MIVHSIMVLFEIINFYLTISDEESIDLNYLEAAFNILATKMEDLEEAKLDYEFDDALDNLLNNYEDYLYIDNDELIINDDLNSLYEEISNDIDMTENDDILEEAILDTRIFDVLELDIPVDEYKSIFNLNKEITNTYRLIAKDEANNILNIINVIYLKRLIKTLNDKLCCLEYLDTIKIKMCIAHFSLILDDDCNTLENFGWYISLFKDKLQAVLDYERIAYIVDEVDILDDDTGEENSKIIKSNHEILNNQNMFNYEIPYFLSSLLLQIDNYTKEDLPFNIKQKLILKKYLLLSSPELKNMEDYFLKHFSFKEMQLPEFNLYEAEDRFASIHEEVINCILNLDCLDKDINEEEYVKIILRILFIKNYLELSLNKVKNEEVINLIIISKFYQNHNYEIVNNLLNTLIFNKKNKER